MKRQQSSIVSSSVFSAALLAVLLPCDNAAALHAKGRRLATEMDAVLEDKFTLYFRDAVTGQGVAGARVVFQGEETQTDSEGAAHFPVPPEVDPNVESKGEALFSMSGYTTTRVPVKFIAGTVFHKWVSVTKALPPGRLRLVLDWGSAPADLDAHLVKTGGWHISFRDMRRYEDLAWLDRDDMDGNGPETITLTRPDASATYSYFVHDFTNSYNSGSNALGNSRAQVRVYSDRGLERTIDVPPGLRGNRWEVVRIVNGEIVVP